MDDSWRPWACVILWEGALVCTRKHFFLFSLDSYSDVDLQLKNSQDVRKGFLFDASINDALQPVTKVTSTSYKPSLIFNKSVIEKLFFVVVVNARGGLNELKQPSQWRHCTWVSGLKSQLSSWIKPPDLFIWSASSAACTAALCSLHTLMSHFLTTASFKPV